MKMKKSSQNPHKSYLNNKDIKKKKIKLANKFLKKWISLSKFFETVVQKVQKKLKMSLKIVIKDKKQKNLKVSMNITFIIYNKKPTISRVILSL